MLLVENKNQHGLRPADLDGWWSCFSTGAPTVTVAGQRWIFTKLPLKEKL